MPRMTRDSASNSKLQKLIADAKNRINFAISQEGLGTNDFQQDVQLARLRLAVYYFDGVSEPLPEYLKIEIGYDQRSGKTPFFNNKSLPSILTPSELLAGAIAVCNRSEEDVNEANWAQATAFIKQYRGPVNKELVDQILKVVKTPTDIYNAIFAIKDSNPSLVRELFRVAARDHALPILSKVSPSSAFEDWVKAENASMIRENAEAYLETIKFDEHIKAIDSNISDFRRCGYSEMEGVLHDLKEMRTELLSAKDDYLNTGKKEEFKASCRRDITGHLETLQQHRGINKIIAPLVNGLLEMLAALQLISQTQLKSGLHSMKTVPDQIVSDLEEKLDEGDRPAPS